jgi:hypothetical protein
MRTSLPVPESMSEVWPFRMFRCQLISNNAGEPIRILSIIRREDSYVEAFDRAGVIVGESRQASDLTCEVELTAADFSKLLLSNDKWLEREKCRHLYECCRASADC